MERAVRGDGAAPAVRAWRGPGTGGLAVPGPVPAPGAVVLSGSDVAGTGVGVPGAGAVPGAVAVRGPDAVPGLSHCRVNGTVSGFMGTNPGMISSLPRFRFAGKPGRPLFLFVI